MHNKPIPDELLGDIIHKIEVKYGKIPFKVRGIIISKLLITATLEILNKEKSKTLPQNARHNNLKNTPDGLDRRLKSRIGTGTCRGHIISDILFEIGIVTLPKVKNIKSGKMVNGTHLISDYTW